MEKELTDKLNEAKARMTFQEFNNALRRGYFKPKMWGGYDKGINGRKISNIQNLTKKRIYYLIYSVLNDLAGYSDFSDCCYNFKDFCDEFGYDNTLRESEKIYKACLEMEEKFNSLKIHEEGLKYMKERVRTEEEDFAQYLKLQIEEQY